MESPQKNYENYMKLMDCFTITEELEKINALHNSLNEKNIMTYVILLETNRKRFTQSQIKWIEDRIDILRERERQLFEKSLDHVDIELASKPILDKSSDNGIVMGSASLPSDQGV
jgi:hypothetical protein